MNSEKPLSIHQILYSRLGDQLYSVYINELEHHYWGWKYHRICDYGSLRYLRKILYHAKIVNVLIDPSWIINRKLHDYYEVLGVEVKNKVTSIQDDFTGTEDILEPKIFSDMGPGTCNALYQMAQPKVKTQGVADALWYSIDGTLTNCLKEKYQFDKNDKINSYDSKTFGSALKRAEIWSVSRFVLSSISEVKFDHKENIDTPFDIFILQNNVINNEVHLKELLQTTACSENLLKEYNSFYKEKAHHLSKTMVLGYLIDELIARAVVPNGMNFAYKINSKTLKLIIDKFDEVAALLKKTKLSQKSLKSKLELLYNESTRFEDTSNLRQEYTQEWIINTKYVADHLRSIGIEARKLSNIDIDTISLIFDTANELWRWIFFLEQRDWFTDKINRKSSFSDKFTETIFQWLRRPWGIVRPRDLQIALKGILPGEDENSPPRILSLLSNFLTSEIEESVISEFGFPNQNKGIESLRTLIRNRYQLFLSRHSVQFVIDKDSDTTQTRKTIRLIFNLFITWIYDEKHPERLESINIDINNLVVWLREGKWLKYLLEGEERFLINRPQRESIQTYLDDPIAYINEIFDFDNQIDLSEWIDTYPPEEFLFGKF